MGFLWLLFFTAVMVVECYFFQMDFDKKMIENVAVWGFLQWILPSLLWLFLVIVGNVAKWQGIFFIQGFWGFYLMGFRFCALGLS